jgi:hypothetical protein
VSAGRHGNRNRYDRAAAGPRRRLLGGLALLPVAALAGCLRPPKRPVEPAIRHLRLEGRPGQPGRGTLVLMLPGIASPPEEFVEAGFPAALAARAPGAEVRLLDSHYAYYEDRSILARLLAEQVLPARSQGFERIWLVGISLGGLGSLGLLADAEAGPAGGGRLAGVVALAPYLGTAGLAREIAAAGGPVAWAATPASTQPETGQPRPPLERRIWRHLATRPGGAPVHLGFGTGDRFAHSHRLLAPLLPADHVATRPGGHDWPVWRALWDDWLARHGQLLLGAA